MRKKGMVGGPFQLLIGIIVFGMALAIGAYLLDMINCWKCTELLKIESTNLREAISSVGKGDVNSKKSLLVEMEDLGSCAKGIYLRKVDGSDQRCETFCPNHPNACWVIVTESSCGGGDIEIECIDISADLNIDYDEDIFLSVSDPNNPWIDGSNAITHTVRLLIEKTGPIDLYIGKP